MNIYAIRDRLIDYYMTPFVGPDDKNVQASVARIINQGEVTSDIAQAPHHFEIWKLGYVTEDGHLVPDRALVQDCAGLVRRGVRGDRHPEGAGAEEATGEGRARDSRNGGNGGTKPGPLPIAPQSAPGPADEVRRPPQGGYPPRNGI